MKEAITSIDLQAFAEDYHKDTSNLIKTDATTKVGIKPASTNPYLERTLTHQYSLEVEGGTVTNQMQSGRCWMFAATNVMRFEVMKNLDLANTELSQAFPLFYDKLEKSNYFLEAILETLDEPLEGRLVAFLLTDPLGDGGQWDMFVSLVQKYGVCPKSAMPESFTSSHTMDLRKTMTLQLRIDAAKLRKLHEDGYDLVALRKEKEAMMNTIYRMLCVSLGVPPKTFTYEVRNKKNEFIRIENITPLDFYNQYVKLDLDDYVSVINAPTKDKPMNHSFTVKFLGNVVGGKKVKYLNLEIDRLKELVLAQLKDNQAVWFGSDVGQFSEREHGFLSRSVYDFNSLFSTDLSMSKADRLDYHESLMTHAMTIIGANLSSDKKPVSWKVENSWGKDTGKDGMYTMDDDWFNEFVYQIVINRKYLTNEEQAAYDSDPIELEPWDPCGSLAL